jgi:hypothetical protein
MANGWYFELPGLKSPHFQTISGISKETGVTQIVDAGTGVMYNFTDQLIQYGELELARAYDNSSDDLTMDVLVEASINLGVKHAGNLVKLHYGQEIFRIAFEGLLFINHAHPDMGINSTEQYMKSYRARVDRWIRV